MINNCYGFVYITKNLVNGKFYVGQKSFTRDWKRYLGSGTALKLAVKKYGRQNFKRYIICYASNEEDLNYLEYFYIKLFKAEISKNFYNILGGYSGCIEAHRKLNSKKRVCLNTKEIFTSATDAALKYNLNSSSIRECCNKNTSFYCGIRNGERLVWCNYHEFLKLSKEEIENRLKLAYIDHKCKEIYCITLDKNFNSISDASNFFNIDISSLSAVLKGKHKSCGIYNNQKLYWVYLDEWYSMSENEKKRFLDKKVQRSKNYFTKKVKCIPYNLIFDSCKKAADFAGLKTAYGISACAKGREKSAGKHPVTGLPLKWVYVQGDDIC